MSSKLPYFRWHPKDFETDENVKLMNMCEIGLYVMCLNHAWVNGSIPNDLKAIAKITRCPLAQVRKSWPKVSQCFYENSEGALINYRLEKERQWAVERNAKSKKGGEIRWSRDGLPLGEDPANRAMLPVRAGASDSESVSVSSEVSSEGDARGRRPDSDLDLEDDFATFAKNSSNRNRLWDRVKCSPKEQAQLGERGNRYEERMGIREVRLAWLVFLSDKLKGDKEIKNPLLFFYGGLDRGMYLEPLPATADAHTPQKVGQSSSSGSPNAPAAQNGAARGLESPLPDNVSRNSLPAAAIRWNGTVTKAPPVVVWPPGDVRDGTALENALADAVFGDNFDKLLLSCQCLMEQGLPEKTACLTFGYMLNNWRKILNGGCNWMKADFTKSTKPKRLTIAEIAAL